MTRVLNKEDHIPVIYYNNLCAKCRMLSSWVVALSCKMIQRRPLNSMEHIDEFYLQHPGAGGYPMLMLHGRPVYGKKVFLFVPLVVMASWFTLIRNRVNHICNGLKTTRS